MSVAYMLLGNAGILIPDSNGKVTQTSLYEHALVTESSDIMQHKSLLPCAFLISVSSWLPTVHSLELSKSACKISLDTITHVSRCPTNKEEYEAESKRKNCSQYNNDECPDLLYHCVWNDNNTCLIDVCAALRHIFDGNCALFSTGFLIIRDNFMRNCSYLTPPCSQYYESTETYRYSGCYTLDANSKSVAKRSGHSEQEVFPTWAIVLLPLACIVAVVAVTYIVYGYRRRREENRNGTNTQDEVTVAMVENPPEV